jgi:hypothetical protein
MLLRHSFIVIYVNIHSDGPIILTHTSRLHIYMAHFPLLPFVSPLYPYSTYLAPFSCDRNRPPPSQVACKLTPFAPPHPVDPPHPNSQNPANPAPNNDDLGTILALGVQNSYQSIGHTLNYTITVTDICVFNHLKRKDTRG